MNAIAKLTANANSVINFLKQFSKDTPDDVTFDWINNDDTTEQITFSNIKKFQEMVNIFYINGTIQDKDGVKIELDANTLGVKTPEYYSNNKTMRFRLLLNTADNKGFPERWMWGVSEDNELIHWGRESNFVAGHNNQSDDSVGFFVVHQPFEKDGVLIKDIFANTLGAYVLYEDGDLYGIGCSTYGQIGQGNTTQYNHLRFILENVVDISTCSFGYHQDYNSILAIDKNSDLWSWGINGYGQLGNGSVVKQTSAGKRVVVGLKPGEGIAKAYVLDTNVISTFVVTTLGRVFSCGYNGDGELGLGDTANRNKFELISGAIDGENIIFLSVNGGTRTSNSAYYKHSVIAVNDKGNMFGWGYNGGGNLGLGDKNNRTAPSKVTYNAEVNGKIVSISNSRGGLSSFIALNKHGDIYGWGYNSYGCLGLGHTDNTLVPTKITITNGDGTQNTSGVKSVFFGGSGTYSYHNASLLITNDNKIFSCGYNGLGQLGLNHLTNQSTFSQIKISTKYVKSIKQVSFGGYSSSWFWNILLDNGKVLGWGDNTYQTCMTNRSLANIQVPNITHQ